MAFQHTIGKLVRFYNTKHKHGIPKLTIKRTIGSYRVPRECLQGVCLFRNGITFKICFPSKCRDCHPLKYDALDDPPIRAKITRFESATYIV